MIKSETKRDKLKSIKIMPYFAGSLVSILCALGLILAFAILIRYVGVSNSLITPVNISIKIVSIAIGVAVATKDGTKGLLKGAAIGFCFILLSNCVFAIISKTFVFGLSFLTDIAFAVAVGMVCGILSVNIRKN